MSLSISWLTLRRGDKRRWYYTCWKPFSLCTTSRLEETSCCSPCVESQHRLAAAWQEDDDDAASRSAPSSADQRSRSHP